ncbi:MAG: ferrochelatase [Planctomycetes bacterium]|nr:ferrochelatase [Planctomycetota bacterium]
MDARRVRAGCRRHRLPPQVVKLLPGTGIVMLGAGDPAGVEDAEDWLRRFHADALRRPLPWLARPFRRPWAESRIAERGDALRASLEALGVDSPFLRVAGGRANALGELLGGEGYVALTLARPTAEETVGLMLQEGIERVVAMPADPHFDPHTGGRDLDAFERAWASSGSPAANLMTLPDWGREDGYLAAIENLCRAAFGGLREGTPPLLFLAPASPGGHPAYRAAAHAAAEELARRLAVGADRWALAEFGTMAESPDRDVEAALAAIPRDGSRRLGLVPTGFASDRLETLHIVDRELTRRLREERTILFRVPCLNDGPEAIRALAPIIGEAARGRGWLQSEDER